jgi:hypothetical protein
LVQVMKFGVRGNTSEVVEVRRYDQTSTGRP